MYTGTCQLYDGYEVSANGIWGWSCYVKNQCGCEFSRYQGLCSPSGTDVLFMDRSIWTMQECADKCLNDTHCKSFNYGEGELHFYSDTCELFSDSASSGDGNEGWSCYSKYCFKVDDDTAYHVHAENNSYGLQERSILFLPIAFIIFLLDF